MISEHEIRRIAHAIKKDANSIQGAMDGWRNNESWDWAGTIEDAAHRLLRLHNDLMRATGR